MNIIEYEPRICECCGRNDVEELWSYKYAAPTRNGLYEFSVRNVICACGFIFVSPAPSAESLSRYYADSFRYWQGQKLDYDVQKRLDFVSRHLRGRASFIEIGSNTRSSFHKELAEVFCRVLTVELNESVESDFRSVDDLPQNAADMVAHYFVLEHIPKVRQFLRKCYDILKVGGVMVCEVPDLRLYPKDPSGLLLHEHTNHFSLETLSQIAAQIGFQLQDHSSELCSRAFGLASAFVKIESRENNQPNSSSYFENKDLFMRGLHKANVLKTNLDNARQRFQQYVENNKKVVFWAANDVLMRFLENRIPECVVIDSNPAKKSFSDKFQVLQPDDARQAIVNSDAIFIFTRFHSADILNSIWKKYGKSYRSEDVIVVDIVA